MLFVGSMGEVPTPAGPSVLKKLPEDFLVLAGRSDGANNLRLFIDTIIHVTLLGG